EREPTVAATLACKPRRCPARWGSCLGQFDVLEHHDPRNAIHLGARCRPDDAQDFLLRTVGRDADDGTEVEHVVFPRVDLRLVNQCWGIAEFELSRPRISRLCAVSLRLSRADRCQRHESNERKSHQIFSPSHNSFLSSCREYPNCEMPSNLAPRP